MSGSAENQKNETNPQGTPTITMPVNHGEKPEKFPACTLKGGSKRCSSTSPL